MFQAVSRQLSAISKEVQGAVIFADARAER